MISSLNPYSSKKRGRCRLAKKLPPLDQYIDFVKRLESHITCHDTFNDRWISNVPVDEPVFKTLLNSFQIGSCHQLDCDLVEWNPLSQRPFYEDFHPPERNLTSEFEFRRQIALKTILFGHEMMHVFLWEPFFNGYSNKLNKRRFTELCLGFEGFCFWYADIYFNSKVNLQFPDGEKIFSRSSVSQKEIHPRSVLMKLRDWNERDLISTYVRSFNGYHTDLTKKGLDIVSRGVSSRIYSFYANSLDTVSNYYNFLKDSEIFDEYFHRFCKIQNIPSLISRNKLKLLDFGNFEDYCQNFRTSIFPHVIQLSKEDVLLVRMRRAIQTRAYFLFNLRFSLLNGHVNSSKSVLNEISQSTNRMIDDLESVLIEFCINKEISTTTSLLASWDQNYDSSVRDLSCNYNLSSSYKLQIHPPLPHHPVLYKKLNLKQLTNKKLITQCQAVLDLVLSKETLLSLTTEEKEITLSQTASLLEDLNKLKLTTKDSKGLRKRIVRTLEKVISYPFIQEKWATPLSEIDPGKNNFRELTLNYR